MNVPRNNINLWEAVKTDLEIKIMNGIYAAGERLPTIVEMTEIYGIGNTTAQKIIDKLHEEDIIVKKMGVGCFVKPYVREKIRDKLRLILDDKIVSAIDYGNKLGVSKEEIIKQIENLAPPPRRPHREDAPATRRTK
ncbi:MAG: GntR family transcriptional regulator [Clostridia bacterium]|jgi:DNA-binding transcriptional regulator YhcF (GntR family)|nr:GntR family transcriptional regulator [Clostridia bacterium]